ncbi:MAG: sugar phosphate isomerase/epimerase [Firmicutes bacterium]|nr:sugar phosphate isomerase/epimerase [Bacillota bacterium]
MAVRLSTSTCIHERVRWGAEVFYTCEDSIRACAQAGYKILDINFATYSRGTLPMTQPDWEEWVKRTKETADALGIEWYQGHAHFYDWVAVDPADLDWHEELIRRSIIGAGIMGVKWLVIHPGTVRDETWYSYQKSLAANLEAFRRYGELAARHNVGIAIENMIESIVNRRYCSSVEELLELHAELDDPLFGICWDTGHAHLSKVDQSAALRQIGGRLKALHIDDNRGERDEHFAPYFGTIEWEPILDTLAEIGFDGCFTFEIHNFTNGLPDGLHAPCLRFTYELGTFMVDAIRQKQRG